MAAKIKIRKTGKVKNPQAGKATLNLFVSVLAGLIFAGVFCAGVYVIAAPPTSQYTLGETLTPNCAPGATNCTVTPPAAYSFAANNFTGTGNFTTTTGTIQGATLKVGSVYTFPTADGTANQYLKTDGDGNVSWGTVDTSGLVPYTGATSAVDLGAQNFTTAGLSNIGSTTFSTSMTGYILDAEPTFSWTGSPGGATPLGGELIKITDSRTINANGTDGLIGLYSWIVNNKISADGGTSATQTLTSYAHRIAMTDSASYNRTTGNTAVNNYGAYFSVVGQPTAVTATGKTVTHKDYGVYSTLTGNIPAITAGTFNRELYGYYGSVTYGTGANGSSANAYGSYTTLTGTALAASNSYGNWISVATTASGLNNYGLYISAVSGATNNYAIYNASNADSDFGSGAITTTGTGTFGVGFGGSGSGIVLGRLTNAGEIVSSVTSTGYFQYDASSFRALLATDLFAGRFQYGENANYPYAQLADNTNAVYAFAGTTLGNSAGKFEDTFSHLVYLSDGTYAINATGQINVSNSGNIGLSSIGGVLVSGLSSSSYNGNNGDSRFFMGVDGSNNPSIELQVGKTGFAKGAATYIDFTTTDDADYDMRMIYGDGGGDI